MMPVKIRTVLFGELAVAADKATEFFYNMAIRANKTAGWLIERRDARPDRRRGQNGFRHAPEADQ